MLDSPCHECQLKAPGQLCSHVKTNLASKERNNRLHHHDLSNRHLTRAASLLSFSRRRLKLPDKKGGLTRKRFLWWLVPIPSFSLSLSLSLSHSLSLSLTHSGDVPYHRQLSQRDPQLPRFFSSRTNHLLAAAAAARAALVAGVSKRCVDDFHVTILIDRAVFRSLRHSRETTLLVLHYGSSFSRVSHPTTPPPYPLVLYHSTSERIYGSTLPVISYLRTRQPHWLLHLWEGKPNLPKNITTN